MRVGDRHAAQPDPLPTLATVPAPDAKEKLLAGHQPSLAAAFARAIGEGSPEGAFGVGRCTVPPQQSSPSVGKGASNSQEKCGRATVAKL